MTPVCPATNTIFDYLGCAVLAINNIIIPLIFALAFIFYIYRVYSLFIVNGADPASQKKGREFAIWGIVGFFVMLSIWGLVNLLINTFSFGNTTAPKLPTFGTSNAAPTSNSVIPEGSPYSNSDIQNDINFFQQTPTPTATPAPTPTQPQTQGFNTVSP